MKILAIRGENLASLARPFAVELDQPPFDGNGLFAITGPTGSGKSTLLDALCVALFDKIPRMDTSQAIPVGREGESAENLLNSNDVRSLLSRGCGHGWAEVDFLGVDRRPYRARWEVTRARGRAAGKWRSQTITLTDLTTHVVLPGGKREVQEQIRQRLGLTYEQFRRSVLLAQGEFAAFLRSDSRQRSELLERITGAWIYSRISQAAYARAMEKKAGLEEMDARLQEIDLLTPEDRETLSREQFSGRQELAAMEGEKARWQGILAWRQHHGPLLASLQQAEAGMQLAEEAWQAAEPRRQRLLLLQRAQPLRNRVTLCSQLRQEVMEATDQLASLDQQMPILVREAEQAALLCQQQRQRLAAVEAAMPAVHAQLRQAQALDLRLAALRQTLGRDSGETASLAATRQTLAGVSRQLAQWQEACQRHQAWLTERAAWQPVVTEAPRWQQEIQRYQRSQERIRELENACQQVGAARQHLAGQQVQQRREEGELGRQLVVLNEEITRLSEAWNQARAMEVATEARELGQRQMRLRETQYLLEQSREGERELATLGQEQASLTREVTAARQRWVVLRDQRQVLEQARQQKINQLEQARQALHRDAASLRASLQPGQPCPVCGGLEHPWSGGTPDWQVSVQETGLASLQTQWEQVQGEMDRLEGQGTGMRQRLQVLEPAIVHRRQRQTALTARQQDLWPNLADGEKPSWLAGQLQEVEQKIQENMVRQQEIQALENRRDQGVRQRDGLRQTLDGCLANLRHLDGDVARLAAQEAGLTSEKRAMALQAAEALAVLAAPLSCAPAWSAMLAHDVPGLARAWQDLATAWQQHADGLAAAQSQIEQSRDQLSLLPQIADLWQERAGVLAGQSWQEVEAQHEATLAALRQAVTDGDARAAEMDKLLTACRLSQIHWQALLSKRQQADHAAEAALQQAVATAGLASRQHLLELLAVEEDLVTREQQDLQRLDQQRRESRVLREERWRCCQEHEQQRPEGGEEPAVASRLQALLQRMETCHQRLAAITGRLQEDEARQERRATLQRQREMRLQEWSLWEGMRELIGAADGNKFRAFAQGLTLDVLLAHANHHLTELAPRYRLERSPKSDLGMQVVDRDMGDEVRSVYSLSGGETFLVSLALALALASVSTSQVRVASLFIDEGFGSLDAETLEMVLASLDTLQARGFQVGVISHMETLTERMAIQVRVVPMGGGRSRVELQSALFF